MQRFFARAPRPSGGYAVSTFLTFDRDYRPGRYRLWSGARHVERSSMSPSVCAISQTDAAEGRFCGIFGYFSGALLFPAAAPASAG